MVAERLAWRGKLAEAKVVLNSQNRMKFQITQPQSYRLPSGMQFRKMYPEPRAPNLLKQSWWGERTRAETVRVCRAEGERLPPSPRPLLRASGGYARPTGGKGRPKARKQPIYSGLFKGVAIRDDQGPRFAPRTSPLGKPTGGGLGKPHTPRNVARAGE